MAWAKHREVVNRVRWSRLLGHFGSSALPSSPCDPCGAGCSGCQTGAAKCPSHSLGDRVHVVQGDACQWLAEQTGQWDLILTNPPYVDAPDMKTLPEEYRHEPVLGLAAGEDGLSLVDRFLTGVGSGWHRRRFSLRGGASAPAHARKYPDLPIQWLELPDGGGGVPSSARDKLRGSGLDPKSSELKTPNLC